MMMGKIGKCNYIKSKNFYAHKPWWNKNINYKFGQDTMTQWKGYYVLYIKNSMNQQDNTKNRNKEWTQIL